MADADRDPGVVVAARRAALLWGGVAAAAGAAIALPLWLGASTVDDPAADAEAAYAELLARIEARDAFTDATAPVAEPSPPMVARDLFSPAAKVRADVAPPRPRRKESALPELSSILIDGSTRHAVLDGRIVEVGEQVGAYRIAAIEPDAVVLRDGPSTHRLTVRRTR